MANIKELRGRIKSVSSIQQITRAMEMVASMKLRKVQAKALAHRPYTLEILELGRHLAEVVGGSPDLPLFREREVRNTGVFLITSDRGLCGSYNANMLARAHDFADAEKERGRGVKFWVYGRRGFSYLSRRGFDVPRFFAEPPLDKMSFAAAKQVVEELVQAFTDEVVDRVWVFHTAFLSAARFEPTALEFLPVPPTELEGGSHRTQHDYLLEPDPSSLLERLVPKYLETVVYDAMLQSLASEHASRRIAMKGATDAAGRMSVELKRIYNRARQEGITRELLDIVGGATAVS